MAYTLQLQEYDEGAHSIPNESLLETCALSSLLEILEVAHSEVFDMQAHCGLPTMHHPLGVRASQIRHPLSNLERKHTVM